METFEHVMSEMDGRVESEYWINMARRLKQAHECELKQAKKAEFHRGWTDGCQHRETATWQLDRERLQVARKLCTITFDGGSHENLSKLAYAIYPCATGWTCESAAGLRERLIHLMGGDTDTTITDTDAPDSGHVCECPQSVDGSIGTSPNDDGTCPNTVPTASITDELREWYETYREKAYIGIGLFDLLLDIADRIDEQFDRICQQHGTVLQNTIDSVLNENEELRAELDRTKELLEISYAKRRAYKLHIEQMKGGSKRWREKYEEREQVLADAVGDNAMYRQMLNDAADEFRLLVDKYHCCRDERDSYMRSSVPATDENMAEHGWVRLPVDMHGHRIAIGDMLHDHEDGHDFKVDGFKIWGYTSEWWAYQENAVQYPVKNCSIVRIPDTAESIVRDLSIGAITEEQAVERIEAL